jgi:hypothetical protein
MSGRSEILRVLDDLRDPNQFYVNLKDLILERHQLQPKQHRE